MWILGLKGLKACTAKKKVVYFPVRLFFTSNRLKSELSRNCTEE